MQHKLLKGLVTSLLLLFTPHVLAMHQRWIPLAQVNVDNPLTSLQDTSFGGQLGVGVVLERQHGAFMLVEAGHLSSKLDFKNYASQRPLFVKHKSDENDYPPEILHLRNLRGLGGIGSYLPLKALGIRGFIDVHGFFDCLALSSHEELTHALNWNYFRDAGLALKWGVGIGGRLPWNKLQSSVDISFNLPFYKNIHSAPSEAGSDAGSEAGTDKRVEDSELSCHLFRESFSTSVFIGAHPFHRVSNLKIFTKGFYIDYIPRQIREEDPDWLGSENPLNAWGLIVGAEYFVHPMLSIQGKVISDTNKLFTPSIGLRLGTQGIAGKRDVIQAHMQGYLAQKDILPVLPVRYLSDVHYKANGLPETIQAFTNNAESAIENVRRVHAKKVTDSEEAADILNDFSAFQANATALQQDYFPEFQEVCCELLKNSHHNYDIRPEKLDLNNKLGIRQWSITLGNALKLNYGGDRSKMSLEELLALDNAQTTSNLLMTNFDEKETNKTSRRAKTPGPSRRETRAARSDDDKPGFRESVKGLFSIPSSSPKDQERGRDKDRKNRRASSRFSRPSRSTTRKPRANAVNYDTKSASGSETLYDDGSTITDTRKTLSKKGARPIVETRTTNDPVEKRNKQDTHSKRSKSKIPSQRRSASRVSIRKKPIVHDSSADEGPVEKPNTTRKRAAIVRPSLRKKIGSVTNQPVKEAGSSILSSNNLKKHTPGSVAETITGHRLKKKTTTQRYAAVEKYNNNLDESNFLKDPNEPDHAAINNQSDEEQLSSDHDSESQKTSDDHSARQLEEESLSQQDSASEPEKAVSPVLPDDKDFDSQDTDEDNNGEVNPHSSRTNSKKPLVDQNKTEQEANETLFQNHLECAQEVLNIYKEQRSKLYIKYSRDEDLAPVLFCLDDADKISRVLKLLSNQYDQASFGNLHDRFQNTLSETQTLLQKHAEYQKELYSIIDAIEKAYFELPPSISAKISKKTGIFPKESENPETETETKKILFQFDDLHTLDTVTKVIKCVDSKGKNYLKISDPIRKQLVENHSKWLTIEKPKYHAEIAWRDANSRVFVSRNSTNGSVYSATTHSSKTKRPDAAKKQKRPFSLFGP